MLEQDKHQNRRSSNQVHYKKNEFHSPPLYTPRGRGRTRCPLSGSGCDGKELGGDQ